MTKLYSIKAKAIELRRQGYSYNYIKNKVGLSSKGTLHAWLSVIPYIPNKETIERIGKARAASSLAKHQIKIASLSAAYQQARKDIRSLKKRDIFMLGIGLYTGEGSKTGDIVRIINSDSRIIKFAIRWFMEACSVKKDNFRIRLHLYPDNDIKNCLKYWSKVTSIPLSQFQRVQIDLRTDKKKVNRRKLPYGTAHLSVKSNGRKDLGVFLARRINGWIDRVLK